jgi:two-component system sensor histidine kinase BaeS
LRFDIEDSAPGIPDSAMPFIFDRLYRVDRSRSRKEGGSGLGLAISKAIVEAHGGRITAGHSQLGGIRIEIIFPVIKED